MYTTLTISSKCFMPSIALYSSLFYVLRAQLRYRFTISLHETCSSTKQIIWREGQTKNIQGYTLTVNHFRKFLPLFLSLSRFWSFLKCVIGIVLFWESNGRNMKTRWGESECVEIIIIFRSSHECTHRW